MSVEFEEEKTIPLANLQGMSKKTTIKKVTDFLIKIKVAKNEKSAELIIIITALILIAGSIALIAQTMMPEKVKYNLPNDVIKSLPTDAQQKIYGTNN